MCKRQEVVSCLPVIPGAAISLAPGVELAGSRMCERRSSSRRRHCGGNISFAVRTCGHPHCEVAGPAPIYYLRHILKSWDHTSSSYGERWVINKKPVLFCGRSDPLFSRPQTVLPLGLMPYVLPGPRCRMLLRRIEVEKCRTLSRIAGLRHQRLQTGEKSGWGQCSAPARAPGNSLHGATFAISIHERTARLRSRGREYDS